MPDWLIPVLTFISGVAGGFVGARVSIVRLETQMLDVRTRLDLLQRSVNRHSSDLLIHDMEIESALNKLELVRVRRQSVQE